MKDIYTLKDINNKPATLNLREVHEAIYSENDDELLACLGNLLWLDYDDLCGVAEDIFHIKENESISFFEAILLICVVCDYYPGVYEHRSEDYSNMDFSSFLVKIIPGENDENLATLALFVDLVRLEIQRKSKTMIIDGKEVSLKSQLIISQDNACSEAWRQ